jgi:hypothetical protein
MAAQPASLDPLPANSERRTARHAGSVSVGGRNRPVIAGRNWALQLNRNSMAPTQTPNETTSEPSAGNGEAICSCGATTRSANSADRCANGRLLRGDRAAAIVSEHGADFRREHGAEIDAMADQFAREAGYSSLHAAPLGPGDRPATNGLPAQLSHSRGV